MHILQRGHFFAQELQARFLALFLGLDVQVLELRYRTLAGQHRLPLALLFGHVMAQLDIGKTGCCAYWSGKGRLWSSVQY